MINKVAAAYLLAFPAGIMGIVQLVFAFLSFALFRDHQEMAFLIPAMSMIIASVIFLIAGKRRLNVKKIGYRDALFFAVLSWAGMGLLGAIPIVRVTGVSFTDAVFESISALTTTGVTALSGLDAMPKSFLMYRQFLQWMGGLGVVIYVVTILPMLNVGGMKLMQAETPGPIKNDKLSARMVDTAHYLWLVYLTITVLCALGFYVAGMTAYDAIAYTFSTVSTGGFAPYDDSMGHYDKGIILIVADVFMMLGALNFALHFRAWRNFKLRRYYQDEETRTYLIVVLVLALIVAFFLVQRNVYSDAFRAFNHALFLVVSMITSTGLGLPGYTEWPQVVVFLLIFSCYLGGCAGSTAGGNKIIRNILSIKMIARELKRLIHPRGVFEVEYQGHPVEDSVLNATIAFMFIAAVVSLVFTLLLMATGLDFLTAFSAVAACVNAAGLAFGAVGSNFQPVNDFGIWVLSLAMLLGRLEYLTVLALLLPSFWRY